MSSSASVNQPSTTNSLLNINQPYVYLPLISIQTLLVIVIILFVFNKELLLSIFTSTTYNGTKSAQANVAETYIVLITVCMIVTLSIYLIPNLNNIKEILLQIDSVLYIVIFTIVLNVAFVMIPSDKLNSYAHIIMPITVAIASFLFYLGFQTNSAGLGQKLNYEVVKAMVLFVCFIALTSLFYLVDPGGYLKKYAGQSLLLGIIMSLFAFLYMISIVTLPGTSMFRTGRSGQPSVSKGSILTFAMFLILIAYGMYNYPGGFFNDKSTSATVLILLLIVSIIWAMFTFSKATVSDTNASQIAETMALFKKSLSYSFGFSVGVVLLAFVLYYAFKFKTTDTKSYVGLLINLLIFGITLSLVYKALGGSSGSSGNGNSGNGNSGSIKEIVGKIIRILTFPFALMQRVYFEQSLASDNSDGAMTVSVAVISLVVLASVGYFAYDKVYSKVNAQGGKVLLDKPISISEVTTLGDYKKLNGSDFGKNKMGGGLIQDYDTLNQYRSEAKWNKISEIVEENKISEIFEWGWNKKKSDVIQDDNNFNYQYGISCWVFVDSNPPNSSASYSKYTSLLNYGGKPNILYKANTRTLLILFGDNIPSDEIDDQEETAVINGQGKTTTSIIYKNDKFLLQKWNNIIVNYTGNTVDIFLNGELVKASMDRIVPIMKFDTLTAGSANGIQGGICNVVYFNKPITSPNIYYIYNTVKDKSPPITDNTIILDR